MNPNKEAHSKHRTRPLLCNDSFFPIASFQKCTFDVCFNEKTRFKMKRVPFVTPSGFHFLPLYVQWTKQIGRAHV